MAEMAENRDDKIVYATYAIYASANFYTGMACLAMDKRRKRGTKVPRTERRKAELMIRRDVISSTHNARA